MLVEMCTAKIHRAKVTEANVGYLGSVTIDREILDAAGIAEFQMVNINSLSNGVLWQTYALAGPPGKGDLCLNGPPARHFLPGDLVIVIAKALVDRGELADVEPVVVFVDEKNRVSRVERHARPADAP